MKLKIQYKIFLEFIILLFLIFLDQITKYLASINLQEGPIVLIENIFEFRYLENRGAAFGILKNKMGFFIIITLIVILAICFIKYRINNLIYNNLSDKNDRKKYMVLDLILLILIAGAIGNFIDRLRLDYVIDFIYFKLIDFPIFNIADCYVTLSAIVIILMFIFLFKEKDYDLLFPSKKIGEKRKYR